MIISHKSLSFYLFKHVELQIIFDRLVSQGNWDHIQLAKYLATERSNLTELEIQRLQITAIWPKEKDNTQVVEGKAIIRYKASDLYAPSSEIREFGLPIIEWNGKWRKNNEEGLFSFSF